MKLFACYNGWHGNSEVFVLVEAKDEEQAKYRAAAAFTKAFMPPHLYGPKFRIDAGEDGITKTAVEEEIDLDEEQKKRQKIVDDQRASWCKIEYVEEWTLPHIFED